jgi:hypothetical protein
MTKAARNPIKKWIMRQYWRMQQSQSIISMALLGSTLTLLIWPYVRWRFEQWPTFLGIPTAYIGLIGIFLCLILGVLTIGYLYDRVFSLWTELRSVDIERNPYWTYALSPTWMMVTATNAEILKRNADGDKELIEHADWILEWCKKCADSEMFGRAVQNWDREMGETPTFWFLDEEIMNKARSYKIVDED